MRIQQAEMVNAFSFCLYGPANPRYYTPLVENLKIAAQYFPDWKVWIHVAPDVDPAYLTVLRSYSNAVVVLTGVMGPANMILRFYTIDDPSVDVMFVRDADSLLHWKDRWAIHRFMECPQFVAHTIRDHKDHTARIMGGLWGIRKSAGLNIQAEYQAYLRNPEDMGIAHDQNFLSAHIYPRVKDRLLVHYSNEKVYRDEIAEPFPFAWSETVYCGRIELPQAPTTRLVNGRLTIRGP
jgi:hypothetical protein